MNTLLKALVLTAAWLVSSAALAGEAVPINASFGVQWTDVDWSEPTDRITECLGAAPLANGRTIAIATRDHLDAVNGRITSDYAILMFSATDWVYTKYENIPAVYDWETDTASFFGPLEVVGGEGRFQGATGKLSIRTKVFFPSPNGYPSLPPVATFDIKGVIKTAN